MPNKTSKKITEKEIKYLIEMAIEARNFSYSPYSNFRVGAALLTNDGIIYKGCNIENVSFSITNCAERTALFKAVSDGKKDFRAVAIVALNRGDEEVFSYPCGACRQALLEFCSEDFLIIVAKNEKEYREYTLKDLMPYSFNSDFLK